MIEGRKEDVLLVGAVTQDVLEGEPRVPGGSVLYASQVYVGFGASVGVVTCAGRGCEWGDEFGGVRLDVQSARETTRFVNTYEEDGARTQWLDAYAGEVRAGERPAVGALHLAPVFGEVDAVEWAEAVPHDLCVLNIQGWVRRVEQVPGRVKPRRWGEEDDARLEVADVVVLSREDLVGQGELLERLKAKLDLVVVTDGAFGCDVFERTGVTHVEAYRTEALDPTGAGDVFSAGLVWGLTRGESAVEAARLGCAAASIVIEGVGPRALSRVRESYVRRSEVEVSRSRQDQGSSRR